MTRIITAQEQATGFRIDAAGLTAEQLRTAADVLTAIAEADVSALERAMTTDGSGNPIVDTPERREAQSIYVEALEVRDRAEGWAQELRRGADRAADTGVEG